MGYWISDAFYGILLTLDYIVYICINFSYQLFEVVSKVEIFSNDELALITRRVYMILGIVMLFVFAYNIILAILNPDTVNGKDDKSFKGMVKNLVVSVVLLITFPLICRYLQIFQNHIVEDNTLGKIITGSTVGSDYTKKAALEVPVTIFTAFYHPLSENGEAVTMFECQHQGQTSYVNDAGKTIELTNIGTAELCDKYVELAEKAATGNIFDLNKFMNNKELKHGIADGKMEYLWLVSTIAGGLAAYMFLSFSLDLGVRAAKLAVLKLIAPVPIFVKVFPKQKSMYDKWQGEFIKTYLQVFERIIVIYFAIEVISFIPKIDWTAGGGGWFINCIASVVIILGILKFAKEAPKLLEELFGTKIPELSIKKKLNDNEYAKRAASLGGALAGNVINSTINNGKKIVEGFKNKDWKGVAGGVAGTILGNPISNLNAARRGWQNGNVDNWRQVGGAINESRAQNEADMNKLKTGTENVAHDVTHPIDTAKNAWEGIKGFVQGGELTNTKLTAAKEMQSMFNNLFDNFKDDRIEEAKKSALKDFYNGKTVSYRVKDANGNFVKDANGNFVTKNLNSISEIKEHFEAEQQEVLLKKFNDKKYSDGIKSYGKTISDQMQKTLNVLGESAISSVLIKNGLSNISDLNDLFAKASNGTLDKVGMENLRKVANSISDQVDAQKLQVQAEKKDKK